MDASSIDQIITTALQSKYFLTEDDVKDLSADPDEAYFARELLDHDERFIEIWSEIINAKCYLPKTALTIWYLNLNISLAKANISHLTNHQFCSLMDSFSPIKIWESIPNVLIEHGIRIPLMSIALESGEYIFPLANVLSFLSNTLIDTASEILTKIIHSPEVPILSVETICSNLSDALTILSPMQSTIIKRRTGILGETPGTLQILGNSMGVCRERIRQIESKAWKKIHHQKHSQRFLLPFLQLLIFNRWSLVIQPGQLTQEIKFLTYCFGIPMCLFHRTELVILGARQIDLNMGNTIWKQGDDLDGIINYIAHHSDIPFSQKDLRVLAEAQVQANEQCLNKNQKVYLALKKLGKPSHFSEVFDVYKSLFPEDQTSEHNVHAIMQRDNNSIVWIGIKGTYALKEWGFERPAMTLFDTVSTIVKNQFALTGCPVSYEFITAEIGKFRQFVVPNSLFIATHLNPSIECVNSNYFVPKENTSETDSDDLDMRLRAFERQEANSDETILHDE